jgi:xylulokinase
MSFLGVDIGQTGCKALVFDETGRPLAGSYREYPILAAQPGWAELDSRQVVDYCKDAIAEVAAAVSDCDAIEAIGVCSQGEAFTVIGSQDQYLCNAMITSDTRASSQVARLSQSPGVQFLYQLTGHSPHTMFSLFKLAWLRDNRPKVLDKAAKVLCFEDLLGYALTGEAVIDHSLAGRTMMFDVRRECWSEQVFDLIGLSPQVMSKPSPSGRIVGALRPSVSQELGLSPGAVVVAGGHDQPCGALGAGVVGPGVAMYSTGTSECISPAFAELLLNDTLRDANLATYHHVVPGLYFTVAFNVTGGNLFRWYRDQFGQREIRQALAQGSDPYDLLMSQIPDEPTSLLVLPHFAATGTPHFDLSPVGAILGLQLATQRGEFIKALLEGVTYEMRLNVEILARAGIAIDELRAIGGGAKSDAWMQIKADIIGKPIVAMEVSEAAGMGAAMLAAVGSGALASLGEAVAAWVRPKRVFEPAPDRTAAYTQRYATYSKLYQTLRPIGQEIAQWRAR